MKYLICLLLALLLFLHFKVFTDVGILIEHSFADFEYFLWRIENL
jgi:hypothetical protein